MSEKFTTKEKLLEFLKSKGIAFDISNLPNDAVIDSYDLDLSDTEDPRLIVSYRLSK